MFAEGESMVLIQIILSLIIQFLGFLYLIFSRNYEKKGKKGKRVIIILFSVGITIGVSIMARKISNNILEYVKIMTLYQILFCAAIIDYRKKIIPHTLIWFGSLFQVICFFFEISYYHKIWMDTILKSVLGILIGAGILFIIYISSKSAIGFGDILLFGMIGMQCGFQLTYSIMFLSFFLAAVLGILLWILGKRKRNFEMSFAPFVLCGYIISLIFV